ncbi:glycosyl hydrolase family 18 protein [Bacteroides cellulosilyticus]|uniref:glycosyl hydrolase family 18 protein n=1 Tax=Bacteroides cellulosilyticus TaxID=246787 RepID=UPI003568C5FA
MKKLKYFLLLIAAMMTGAFITSCSNDDYTVETQQEAQPTTRSVNEKTPMLTTYIETNDINPLNAGEYYFTGTNPQEQVIDNVILFASNIRGTASTVQLYHNNNQSYILANANLLIAPLQNKGIKVSLGLLGDHTGVGFSNLTSAMIESFAQQIAACVKRYNLDGVDFDDEYAEYWKAPSNLPSPSTTIFGDLIKRVRQLLPDKLITVFHFGGYTYFDTNTMNAISYMWPNFGTTQNPPAGLSNSKWARMSIHCTDGIPTDNEIQSCADNYSAYGAIMMFNLRETGQTNKMNNFASRVWGGKTVTRSTTIYSKNY